MGLVAQAGTPLRSFERSALLCLALPPQPQTRLSNFSLLGQVQGPVRCPQPPGPLNLACLPNRNKMVPVYPNPVNLRLKEGLLRVGPQRQFLPSRSSIPLGMWESPGIPSPESRGPCHQLWWLTTHPQSRGPEGRPQLEHGGHTHPKLWSQLPLWGAGPSSGALARPHPPQKITALGQSQTTGS